MSSTKPPIAAIHVVWRQTPVSQDRVSGVHHRASDTNSDHRSGGRCRGGPRTCRHPRPQPDARNTRLSDNVVAGNVVRSPAPGVIAVVMLIYARRRCSGPGRPGSGTGRRFRGSCTSRVDDVRPPADHHSDPAAVTVVLSVACARVGDHDGATAARRVSSQPLSVLCAGRFRLQKDPVRCRRGRVASRQPPEVEKR